MMNNKKYTKEDLKPGFVYCTCNGIVGIVTKGPRPSDWNHYLSEADILVYKEHNTVMQYGVEVYFSHTALYTENVSVKSILDGLNNMDSECLREVNES